MKYTVWPFLIGRTKTIDHRVILAPDFMEYPKDTNILDNVVRQEIKSEGEITISHKILKGRRVTIIYRSLLSSKINKSYIDDLGRNFHWVEGFLIKDSINYITKNGNALDIIRPTIITAYEKARESEKDKPYESKSISIDLSSLQTQSYSKRYEKDKVEPDEKIQSDITTIQRPRKLPKYEEKKGSFVFGEQQIPDTESVTSQSIECRLINSQRLKKPIQEIAILKKTGFQQLLALQLDEIISSIMIDNGKLGKIIWDMKPYPGNKFGNLAIIGDEMFAIVNYPSMFNPYGREEIVIYRVDERQNSGTIVEKRYEAVDTIDQLTHNPIENTLIISKHNDDNSSSSMYRVSDWTLATKSHERTVPIKRVICSPHKNLLAVAYIDGIIVIKTDDEEKYRLKYESQINEIEFHPSKPILAICSEESHITLWQFESDQITQLNGHYRKVNSISFNTDGNLLISGSDDRTSIIWDVSTSAQLFTIDKHNDDVKSVRFMSSTVAFTSSYDRYIYSWNIMSL